MKKIHHQYNSHQVSLGLIVWLVCFALLLCAAGIGIGILKNKQIDVVRDIERMDVEVNACELNKEHYRARIASNTSRWAINDRLVQDASQLQNIDPVKIEFVRRKDSSSVVASQ